ncbi:predicted protein [Thalassiosira pseudonana CCMP1335]|uniref:Sulfotransferase domain-containing protein n=1 Tax=Thalassiosira pseudonana TaxID=35128 RepID=B8CAN8_THAPS|nr:predicted protein [Thalassiosira pseudonana CCMP1335]EED89537.1 predicted protein [Thalassiosira pseudonana CCMP1335]|eukprot:scaffold2445_cov205-Alexandrium_tamarense.AAC.8
MTIHRREERLQLVQLHHNDTSDDITDDSAVRVLSRSYDDDEPDLFWRTISLFTVAFVFAVAIVFSPQLNGVLHVRKSNSEGIHHQSQKQHVFGNGKNHTAKYTQPQPPSAPSNTNKRDRIRLQQIENYKRGNALLLNIHITHHAGTTVCEAMKSIGPTPENACNMGSEWPVNVTKSRPWTFDETAPNALELRKYYHMISWEHGIVPKIPLEDVDWENPHLVSMIVMKDPIDRRLAGDGGIIRKYGKEEGRTMEQWHGFAADTTYVNFMLTRLTPDACGKEGENTTIECLENAKALLERITFVLDVECLSDGMDALAQQLGFAPPNLRKGKSHPSAKERIPEEVIYDLLLKRNRRDIELYEWSKGLSLVNCSEVDPYED